MVDHELTGKIIGAAIEVHRVLGPGLLESAYEITLVKELSDRGVKIDRQVILPIEYKGEIIDPGYRMDLVVEDSVVVELKAVEELNKIHMAQTLTYMKLSHKSLGLLINFNVTQLTKGIKRLKL